jgi:hypothetical protein
MKLLPILSLLALVAAHASAIAGPTCTSEPKEKWISEEAMKAKIKEQGLKYEVFKVTKGNCYEIYGFDAAGKKVEIYFHPLDGKVVESNTK